MATKLKLTREKNMSFFVSAGLGALIWAASPFVTGKHEPWDAESMYYLISLCIAGIVTGSVYPRKTWPVLPGIVLGQLAYMLIALPHGPLLLVGIAFLFLYSLLSWISALVAALVRRRLKP